MSMLLPPKRLIHPARNGRVQSLWDKCILAIPFWSGVPRDVSGNDVPVNLVGAPPIVPTDIGYALDLNGSSQAAWADLPVLAPAFRSNRISVTIVYKQRTDQGASYYELSPKFSDPGNDKTFRHADLGTYDGLQVGGDYTEILRKDYDRPPLGEWSLSTNRFEHAPDGGTVMRADRWLSGDEKPVASLVRNDSTSLTGAFGDHEIYFGAREASSDFLDGQIAAFIIHDRMLSEPEIRLLGRDPFVMFRQDPIEIISMAGEAAAGGTTGTGDVTAPASTASGTGTRTVSGAGAATSPTAISAGVGVRTATGQGDTAAPAATASGAGVRTASGTGDVSASSATASGSGIRTVTGEGDASAPAAEASGTDAGGATAGTGNVTAPSATVSGAGTRTVVGEGSAEAAAPSASGEGVRTVLGEGAAEAAAPSVSAAGNRTIPGSGSIVPASATASGSGTRTVISFGASTAPPVIVTGEGVRTVLGTGSAISPAAIVEGRNFAAEPVALIRATATWDELTATATWDEFQATATWRQ